MAGIAAGRSGVAYGANIISIMVTSYVNNEEECRGQSPCLLARSSDVVAHWSHVYDLRWCIQHRRSQRQSCNRWLRELLRDAEIQEMKDAMSLLRSVNIATIVASGNESLTNALGYPACISSAVSVGATGDGSADDAPLDSRLATFQQRSVLEFTRAWQAYNFLSRPAEESRRLRDFSGGGARVRAHGLCSNKRSRPPL